LSDRNNTPFTTRGFDRRSLQIAGNDSSLFVQARPCFLNVFGSKDIAMSVSSVTSTPPATPIQPIAARPEPKKPETADERNPPPPARPPLPPGQGTRIDQYV
jgi:hypothetical protein